MIYDLLELDKSWEIIWLFLIPIFAVIYKAIKKTYKEINEDKFLRNFLNGALLLVCFVSFLQHLGTVNRNNQLDKLKTDYSEKKYQTSVGIIKQYVNKRNGLDKFSISNEKFLRVDPHKQIPLYGCWKGFVEDIKNLDGKRVKMDFINFPKSVYPPFEMGNEKVDQICILRFEIIE